MAVLNMILLMMLITGLFAACTQTEVVENTATEKPDPITSLAWEIVNRDIANYESNPAVKIVDSKITRLELVESFDSLADKHIEVYALEYRLLPKDLSKVVMAGGMDVDEDGWLKEKASMGSPLMVIYDNDGDLELLGTLWTGGMIEDGGMEASIKALLERKDSQKERTLREEAIVSFYDNTTDPIIIYEQIPFEGGTLVLAEKLMDGEHYPDLHFVDENNNVAYLTQGSYCWTLNYTQFRGHYIYFGVAGVETRQYNGDQISVERVEVLFSDRTVSVIPREEIIANINPMERDTRIFKDPKGYIIPVEGRNMPEDFMFTFENGESKSISRIHIERSIDHMPDYFDSKNKEAYNSFAFTFTPMLTPTEWDKGYKEGEICLEGKTDNNGNRNILYLRSAGHMSFMDSFILPQDIKSLYLSDNYPRTASFSAGETVAVKYPDKRELLDCRILRLSREKVEEEIGQDNLKVIGTFDNGKLLLPEEKGYYLFLLRTVEDKEIQTYTGVLIIS